MSRTDAESSVLDAIRRAAKARGASDAAADGLARAIVPDAFLDGDEIDHGRIDLLLDAVPNLRPAASAEASVTLRNPTTAKFDLVELDDTTVGCVGFGVDTHGPRRGGPSGPLLDFEVELWFDTPADLWALADAAGALGNALADQLHESDRPHRYEIRVDRGEEAELAHRLNHALDLEADRDEA